MCLSNKQHYVSPLKKTPTKLNEDLQMLMPSRNLPATCGLTLIQNHAGFRILKLSFYYLSSSKM